MFKGLNKESAVIFTIIIGVIFFPSLVFGQVVKGNRVSILRSTITELTNNERKSQNLTVLTINSLLNKAAQAKARDMASKGYFSHISPQGKNPSDWINLVGYRYQVAGENLAVNFTDPQELARAWMNSPTHRANILKGNYREVGTGVATGLYKGKKVMYVVQVYANPAPHKIVKNPPKKPQVSIKNTSLFMEKYKRVTQIYIEKLKNS